MVSVTIQQDTSAIPPMTTPIFDLTLRPDSPNIHQPLQATATKTKITTTITIRPPPPQPQQSTTDSMLLKHIGKLEHIMANLIQDNKHLEERLDSYRARLYTLENLDIPHQVSKAVYEIVTDAIDWAIQAPLQNRFRDLIKEDMKEILYQRMWETNSYKTHEDHMMLCPSGTLGSLEASGSSQVPPPPPPPPSANQEGQSHGSTAPSFSKTITSGKYKSWIMTDTRLRLSVSSTPKDLQMDDDMDLDAQAHSSYDEDTGNAYIPKNNWAYALASTYLPPQEDSILAQTGDMAMFMDWFYKSQGITNLNLKTWKALHLNFLKSFILIKPLPLGGPPSQVRIQSDFFFNKGLEYVRYGSKGSRPVLSISKMKVAYYPDVGLEQMVPDQMFIADECKYDIAVMYGISHWWFQRQRFDRHTSEGDVRAIRAHMRILIVVKIKVFSMYGYEYMKKIVLHRADVNEHIIAERDFKYLYPSDFKDLYLLDLQGHLNHLPPKDKKILTTAVNLWTRHLDATGFEYKHNYTVIDSPRPITFWDRYGVQMIMRFNEIYKFSNGTLYQIDEAFDYRVKELKNHLLLFDIEDSVMDLVTQLLAQIALNLNAGRANNGDGSSNARRGYNYKTFMASNPKEFYGNEGAIGLMSWFENVESKLNNPKEPKSIGPRLSSRDQGRRGSAEPDCGDGDQSPNVSVNFLLLREDHMGKHLSKLMKASNSLIYFRAQHLMIPELRL
nr:hypothetical protein [Tanacetum cinerariifolium]